MPHLATIHDGSTGEPATGYSGCMAVACEPRTRQMIPLHLRMWSSEAPDFISENHQVLEVMRTIHQAAEGRGIFVYDRGGDRNTIMLALYFISVHIGMELRLAILARHIITASKRFYGVSEFCYYALADGVGALLSRIRPKPPKPPPVSPQEMLPGFS